MTRCRLGLDVGSTTIKAVVLYDEKLIFKTYKRHGSDLKATLLAILCEVKNVVGDEQVSAAITGSGALGLHEPLGLRFIQELDATATATRHLCPEASTIIELGGEDAKMIFLGETTDYRMNDTCAGGTGAFIDQMAALLGRDAAGLEELAKNATTPASIASRCGVFAKTDVQASMNDGESRSNLALGIFDAVARQSIGQLAHGRAINGHVILLGGPLTFLPSLRERFIRRLEGALSVTCPENAELFASIGSALCAPPESTVSLLRLIDLLEALEGISGRLNRLRPLFADENELEVFKSTHTAFANRREAVPSEPLYLGIDLGSTTLKIVLMAEDKSIVRSWYMSNGGKARQHIEQVIADIARDFPKNEIVHSTATGYGEKLLLDSFGVTSGEVETIAHLRAAKHWNPEVTAIFDIGGQDIKVMTVSDGHIENVQLNEACSSGCGSFLEAFAKPLGLSTAEFADLALESTSPVDLGTRCTVFMNSCVRQAQNEHVPLPDIAAGLAYSVVKNALYKVARLRDAADLGENIVVQGGTFLNDAVLRAFELEIGRIVTRPDIAGLMGAYGAALLAHDRAHGAPYAPPARAYPPNLVKTKLDLLLDRKSSDYRLPGQVIKGQIGIPLALNMFDNYPFWHALLSSLGFEVVPSSLSTKDTYQTGIATIFSGTVCYPAKLLHGHIIDLARRGLKRIFLPAIKWEIKEDKKAKNHYNCPVVMGYPNVMVKNLDILESENVDFFGDFLSLDRPRELVDQLCVLPWFSDFSRKELKEAVKIAKQADETFRAETRKAGNAALKWLEDNDARGIVLAGHPYHIDPEVNHGIPKMIAGLGQAVFTEDSISHLAELDRPLRIVDQWTYHLRTIASARFAAEHPKLDLVQLISFGCGLDAVIGDQVEEILHHFGKLYTSLKIDEISNLGAARIRIRSLLAATNNT